MQNPKTGGNRFNPDIRPSEIDTYTEANGEQTAEYKIVNTHPIIGGILNKLAFFRTHAAAVWYNRLANKTVKQKFDDVDAAVGQLNERLGKVYSGNLNDFVETGMYWINYSGSTNLPVDRAGALMVISNSDHSYLVQFFGDTVDRYFIRHKEGDSWSTWKEYVTKSYIDNKLFQNVIIKQFDSKITSTQNPGEIDRIHINIEQQEGYRQVCITRGWITNPKLMVYNLFESGGGADITFANIASVANTGGNVYIQVLFQKI